MSQYPNMLNLATAIVCLTLCMNVSAARAETGITNNSSYSVDEVRKQAFDAMKNREAEYFELVNDLLYLLGKQPLDLKDLREIKEHETNIRQPLLGVPNRIRSDYLLQRYEESTAADLAKLRLALEIGYLRLPDSEISKFYVFVSRIKCDTEMQKVDKQYILQFLTDNFKDSLPSADLALLNFNAISQAPNFTNSKAEHALAQLEQDYDKPYRRVDTNDKALVQVVEKVIETADRNNKREFLVIDSRLVNLLFKYNTSKDVQGALQLLVEKYSVLDASTQSLAEAYTYLGCACLKNNNYADACIALESADQLLATLPDSLTTFVAKTALAFCYGKMGKEAMALKVAEQASRKPSLVENSSASVACCQTIAGQIYLRQRKYAAALKFLKQSDEWYRRYPNRVDQLPYGYTFLSSILPQENDMLEALEQAYTINGMHKLANQIDAELKKVLSDVQEYNIEIENQVREFMAAGAITSEEAKKLCGVNFDAKDCAALDEAIDSTATRAYFAKQPDELRNYCHSLIEAKDFKRAQAILLATTDPNGRARAEEAAMLAFCFYKNGHPSLADSTMQQIFNGEYYYERPRIASLKRARSTAALFCYAAKIARAEGNSIRAERFTYDCKMWVESDELKNTDYAKLISQICPFRQIPSRIFRVPKESYSI